MSINWTRLSTQLGAELKNLRKTTALIEQVRDATASTYNRRVIAGTADNAYAGYMVASGIEGEVLAQAIDHFDTSMIPALNGVFSSQRSMVEDAEDGHFASLIEKLSLSKEDQSTPIQYTHEDTDGLGTIVISGRQGVLAGLRGMMLASGQYVSACTITIGTMASGRADNAGDLSGTTITGISHALTGTVTLKCVGESVSRPEFSVTNTLTKPLADGTPTVSGQVNLVADKSYENGYTGLTILASRPGLLSPTLTDAHSLLSGVTVTSPQDGDCTKGIFYGRVTRQAAAGNIWRIDMYSNSTMTTKTGSYVASGTAGAVALTKILRSKTVLAFNFHLANANANIVGVGSYEDVVINIRTPRIGDEFRFTVVNNGEGNFNREIAESWRISMPTTGTGLWTNSLAAKQSYS